MKTSIKIGVIITYIIAVITTSSCDKFNNAKFIESSGTSQILTKQLPFFEEVKVSGMFDVDLKIGESYQITINSDTNITPYIIAGVKDEILYIKLKENISYSSSALKITITSPNYKEIQAAGSSNINLVDLETKELSIDMSGASSMKGGLIAEDVEIDLSGSSLIEIRGKANLLKADLSGASAFFAKDFVINTLNADLSGSSVIDDILIIDTLISDVSGASMIKYRGNLKYINNDVSSASVVTKIENNN
jgi:hypothetical protein